MLKPIEAKQPKQPKQSKQSTANWDRNKLVNEHKHPLKHQHPITHVPLIRRLQPVHSIQHKPKRHQHYHQHMASHRSEQIKQTNPVWLEAILLAIATQIVLSSARNDMACIESNSSSLSSNQHRNQNASQHVHSVESDRVKAHQQDATILHERTIQAEPSRNISNECTELSLD